MAIKMIDRKYLHENRNHIFVFGDNTTRKGTGGAAILRDEPNTYGFITQILPSRAKGAHYKPERYVSVYEVEIKRLKKEIENNPEKKYLISRVGGGLANKFGIWEKIIEPRIRDDLAGYSNIEFLWDEGDTE